MAFRNQKIHDDIIKLINYSRKNEDDVSTDILTDTLKYVNRLEARLLGKTQTLNNLQKRYEKWELK